MTAIRAIYENGVFRPLRPVGLPEGAPVELIVVEGTPDSADKAGSLVGEELAALLDQVASLPYSPHPDRRTDISERHDDILYPKNGKQP